jgi:hypothetical protein
LTAVGDPGIAGEQSGSGGAEGEHAANNKAKQLILMAGSLPVNRL